MQEQRTVAHWPAFLALAAIAGLNYALPEALSLGPRWLLAAVLLVFGILEWIAHLRQAAMPRFVFGLVLNCVVTVALVASVVLLVKLLPSRRESPTELLESAASLWFSNVLVFASWYWVLDAGGPHARLQEDTHESGAFLFPQMALHEASPAKPDVWHPGFIDYLFLSFNTSTALSPTDTQVLSRWAKLLMMVQSLISLSIVVLLAARAVNIL